jgi:hypothetical protein
MLMTVAGDSSFAAKVSEKFDAKDRAKLSEAEMKKVVLVASESSYPEIINMLVGPVSGNGTGMADRAAFLDKYLIHSPRSSQFLVALMKCDGTPSVAHDAQTWPVSRDCALEALQRDADVVIETADHPPARVPVNTSVLRIFNEYAYHYIDAAVSWKRMQTPQSAATSKHLISVTLPGGLKRSNILDALLLYPSDDASVIDLIVTKETLDLFAVPDLFVCTRLFNVV